VPPHRDDPYDRLYPSYAEVCAVPQIKRKGEKPGGTGGHAVLFLKGVCLERGKGYPRLKMCDPSSGPEDPDRGVGISVNKMFKNTNWVGIEGKNFLLRGDLSDSQPANKDTRARMISYVMEKGFYRGIVFHSQYMAAKPAAVSDEQFIADQSFGTDFALNLGRDIYCSRIPMEPSAIKTMVYTLNALNQKYFESETGFHWNGIRNNCTHPIYAALASVGFIANKSTNRTLFSHLTDLAIPSRLFVASMRMGNDRELEDARDLFDDPAFSKAVTDFGYLPFRPGVIAERIPAHTFQNEIFDKGETFLFGVGLKFRWQKSFAEILSEPRYLDPRANLLWFQNRYLEARQKLQNQMLSNPRIRAFREVLLTCLARTLDNLEYNLRVLEGGEGH
jgi:hypothetical protein